MSFVNRSSLRWLYGAMCIMVVFFGLAGCKGDSDPGAGPDTVKLGTDKMPQAPNQGTPPGMVDKSGAPANGGPGVMPMPGNKGKH